MSGSVIRVNAKNQITVPKSVREKLDIKAGDQLLMDVQENIIILFSKAANNTKYLRGLCSEIREDIDTDTYLNAERAAW